MARADEAAIMRLAELRTPANPEFTAVVHEASKLSTPDAAMRLFSSNAKTTANMLDGRVQNTLDHIIAGTHHGSNS